MDNFTAINVFLATVEQGSLAAASRQFNITPPMASRYLRALESSLSVLLLQRTTRKLTLTPAGKHYYDRCRKIMDELEQANQEVAESAISLSGELSITAPVMFGEHYLGEIIAQFLEQHENVTLKVKLTDHYLDMFTEGISLAIRIGHLADSTIIAQRLAGCPMMVCAGVDYLRRKGVPTRPEDIAHHDTLLFSEATSPDDWTLYSKGGERFKVSGRCRLRSDNMQLLLNSALNNIGIAYGPRFVFQSSIDAGSLVPVLEDYAPTELTTYAVYPSRRYLPALTRAFLDHLKETLRLDRG
ncbi:LysR family transcriptional regulator [Rouxiella badensis]|uniref:LysR family transcriptional regulator n=1 Tax=Rouxiella badensis TaxID=1646377 RepID=UPI0013EF137A|nr:LysR family transcriptional regulator [Rouxiella badensis]QII40343.1 LysR family transcriptional regulator [Rouxiella badensis]